MAGQFDSQASGRVGGQAGPKPSAGRAVGANGVAVPVGKTQGAGYRTYEVHQRQRVGQSTAKIKPRELIGDEFIQDPYPYLALLRENYPCYLDWLSNRYHISRYDDVTSIAQDTANFATRSKLWHLDMADCGRDLSQTLPVLESFANSIDDHWEPLAQQLTAQLLEHKSAAAQVPDLAQFAVRYTNGLLLQRLALPQAQAASLLQDYWRAQTGVGQWGSAKAQGQEALCRMAKLFDGLLGQRRQSAGSDLISRMANLEVESPVTGTDVAATLLAEDYTTLQGAFSNLWYSLLTQPESLAEVATDVSQVKAAYLETLRLHPPVLHKIVYARHEVERFGQLLPEGAALWLWAAAANRDPRIFADAERFDAQRLDLTQREPRGQYRADGQASGISFGFGAPSIHPAVPEDRPRSRYALVRDAVVGACQVLLTQAALAPVANTPLQLTSLGLGQPRSCWRLPVKVIPR